MAARPPQETSQRCGASADANASSRRVMQESYLSWSRS